MGPWGRQVALGVMQDLKELLTLKSAFFLHWATFGKCTCSILGRYTVLLPLVWFTRLGINPPASEHKKTVLYSPWQKKKKTTKQTQKNPKTNKKPNKHLQKVINPYEYMNHLQKARFITVAYKVQGYNSHLWCLGLMFKSATNSSPWHHVPA